MAIYSKKIMEHFTNPHNVGELCNANGIGEVGKDSCGDIVKIYLKIKNNIIEDVKFETYGCPIAIASSSVATDLIKKQSINKAQNIQTEDIISILGEIPKERISCSVLAQDAIKIAIENYKKDIKC